MTDQASDMTAEFPINQTLLEDATRSMEEWRVLKDRLAKIDENKGQVSESVYKRVRKDYEDRLSKATDLLMQRKIAVDRELKTLKDTRTKVESEFGAHKQRLEEIKFRNTLGEFSEEDYQTKARFEQDKISKFEAVIAAVEANTARYKSVFEGDEDVLEVLKQPAGAHTKEEIRPDVKAETDTDVEAQTGEHELEGPNYFGAPQPMTDTTPGTDASQTLKQHAPSKSTKNARVILINGEDAGQAYPLKGVVSLGRAESNTIVLKDAKVSRQHAQIQEQGGEFVVLDLNSSNGTFVNGQRVEEHVLTDGDEIKIGDYLMQFEG